MPQTTFRRRVLLVDADEDFLRDCADALRKQNVEVLTAQDGFGALQLLRGGMPDLLVSGLSLPHMSGFELLSVVRTRFPQIAVVATSDEYEAATLPVGTIADAFVPKGTNAVFEVIAAVTELMSDSPLRPAKAKSDVAPVWVPRSPAPYIILTCPECLRSFSVTQPARDTQNPLQETCLACGGTVRYWLSSSGPGNPALKLGGWMRAEDIAQQMRTSVSISEDAVAASRRLIAKRAKKRRRRKKP